MFKIKWDYCECGCHGNEAGRGDLSVWLYNDLRGNYYLHKGHGFYGTRIGTYDSYEAADQAAFEYLQRKWAELTTMFQNIFTKKEDI